MGNNFDHSITGAFKVTASATSSCTMTVNVNCIRESYFFFYWKLLYMGIILEGMFTNCYCKGVKKKKREGCHREPADRGFLLGLQRFH